MITIDSFLLSRPFGSLNGPGVSDRDLKVLASIANQIRTSNSLTENQANLVVKILKENPFLTYKSEVDLENPIWGVELRPFVQTRRVFKHNDKLAISFTFNKETKAEIVDIVLKDIEGYVVSSALVKGINYLIDITEYNIYKLVSTLRPLKFEFEQWILDLYDEVSVIVETNSNPFSFYNLSDAIAAKVNVDATSPLQVSDKRIKYQYSADDAPGNTLAARIANRSVPKVYIDRSVDFSQILSALHELNRKNILVIFDPRNENISSLDLDVLRNTLDSTTKVGVYFRFEASPGTTFNQKIKEYGFNQYLDHTTNVVGISSTAIPKFLFKTSWKPDAVISFTTGLRNNKVDMFCESNDLIIYYTPKKPLETMDAIM